MSLLSRFFYKKPPDGLLEFIDRVYVFDSCFSTEVLPDGMYPIYLHEIVTELHEEHPDSSFLAFNFRDGDRRSQFAEVLNEYDITVVDYPRHYEGCPILPLSLIQHFLRACGSWLSNGNNQNVILLHCERGGWPLLAFLLACLLIFLKLHTEEQKTLEAVHREAPKGLLLLLSPLNPFPSQLRYIHYVARRNISPEWPPIERGLSMDCLILRNIPNFDSNNGCRPLVRVFGRSSLGNRDNETNMLFSLQKKRTLRHYRQVDCDVIKIDIQCLVQGDVVLECVHLEFDPEKEVMMFRIMFNTAFIRSNILILNSDDIDIMWDSKERYPKGFRAEVLFGDAEHLSPVKAPAQTFNGVLKGGLPIEAFCKVRELFGDLEWIDSRDDATFQLLKEISANTLQEKLRMIISGDITEVSGEQRQDSTQTQTMSSLSSDEEKDPATSDSIPPSEAEKVAEVTSVPYQSDDAQVLVNGTTCSTVETSDIPDGSKMSVTTKQGNSSATLPPPPPPLPPKSVLTEKEERFTVPPIPPPPPPSMMPLIKSMAPPPPPPPPLRPLLPSENSKAPPPPPPLPLKVKPLGDNSPQPSSSVPPYPSPPPPPQPPTKIPSLPHGSTGPRPPPPPPPLSNNSSNKAAPVPPAPPPIPSKTMPAPPSSSSVPKSRGTVPPPPGRSSSIPTAPSALVPPPPAFGTGRNTAISLSKDRGSAQHGTAPKKASLKPLHWVKVTRAMQGSLWAETQKKDNETRALDIDLSEIESLFSTAVANDVSGRSGSKHNSGISKPEIVHLVDMRRANNCEIMLTKIKMPLPDLISAVLTLDTSALDVDQVENLIKFCPTNEEIEMLKNYSGNQKMLGKCEQFFLELMKVPRVEAKLKVFAFRLTFSMQVAELRANLCIINEATREIRESSKLLQVMQTILTLGNVLNQGTARGSAVGFRLDSLLKLSDTRARNNKMTLMHYLCKLLAEKIPELLDFGKDLIHLEAASKIQLKLVAEEMQAINKGLEKVDQELTASENDGDVSAGFCKVLKSFLDTAEADVRSLSSLYADVGRNADLLAQYFGEDPARCTFEQVISILVIFVSTFNRARVENTKSAEAERKKLEREKMDAAAKKI